MYIEAKSDKDWLNVFMSNLEHKVIIFLVTKYNEGIFTF